MEPGVVPLPSGESFPRMWDQRESEQEILAQLRIIPTYVGSTISYKTYLSGYPNHSHVCGINALFIGVPDSPIESFPRMWDQPLQKE